MMLFGKNAILTSRVQGIREESAGFREESSYYSFRVHEEERPWLQRGGS